MTIDNQSHAAAAAPTEVEIQVAQENNQSQAVAATTIETETETETEMLVHALTLEPIERRTHYGDTSRCAFSKDEYKKYFPVNWDSEWRNNGTTYEPPEVYLEQYRLFRGGIWNFGDFSANLPKSAFRVYTVSKETLVPKDDGARYAKYGSYIQRMRIGNSNSFVYDRIDSPSCLGVTRLEPTWN